MRKFFTHVLCALVIGLCVSFPAQAGRTVQGAGQGIECDCGLPAPPACFDDITSEPCHIQGEQSTQQESNPSGQSDVGSLGLLLLTTLLVLKRFF